MASLTDRIAELQKAVDQHRRFAARVRTQNAVTKLLAQSGESASAIADVLRAICESLGWPVGVYWTVDRHAGVLECAHVQCPPSPEVAEFIRRTRQYTFPKGHGLPGEVWETGAAVSRPDLLHAQNYSRLEAAAHAGLRSAFAVPVALDTTILGVMEFYTHEADLLDEDLLTAMTSVGLQTGQFLARKRTEQQLRLSQESYRLLAETAPDAILTMGSDGNVVFANAAAMTLFGYSEQEFDGLHITVLMPADLRDRHTAAMRRYIATREKGMAWRGVRMPGLRKDGSEVSLELSFTEFFAGGQQLFTAFIRDLSEQRRLEQKLETSREHLLLALQAGRMGTWEWEVETGRVVWSPGLEELHGRVPGTFPGRVEAVLEEVVPEDRERVQQAIGHALQTGSSYRVQYRIQTPRGESRTLDARGKVYFGPDGKPERMLGVCAAVTDR